MEYQSIKIHDREAYKIIEIDNGKVNAINFQLISELNIFFDAVNSDRDTRGLILAGKSNCFSAGLDVVELAQHTKEKSIEFWFVFNELIKKMITFQGPLVGAITGYAPAGATILALTCDYRIMAQGEKFVMGMHEFKLGFQIPEIWCYIYSYYIGKKQAWNAIQNSELYPPDQALSKGLIDKVVQGDEVLTKAEDYIQKQLRIVPDVYKDTKKFLNAELFEIMNFDSQKKAEEHYEKTSTPESKANLMAFINKIKSKS